MHKHIQALLSLIIHLSVPCAHKTHMGTSAFSCTALHDSMKLLLIGYIFTLPFKVTLSIRAASANNQTSL